MLVLFQQQLALLRDITFTEIGIEGNTFFILSLLLASDPTRPFNIFIIPLLIIYTLYNTYSM